MDELSDLDICSLCARAMKFQNVRIETASRGTRYIAYGRDSIASRTEYRPLHDKAQAFELVERFKINIIPPLPEPTPHDEWLACIRTEGVSGKSQCLLRAICLCVAKMDIAKNG